MGQKVKGQFWRNFSFSEDETSKTGHKKKWSKGKIKNSIGVFQRHIRLLMFPSALKQLRVHPAASPREDLLSPTRPSAMFENVMGDLMA